MGPLRTTIAFALGLAPGIACQGTGERWTPSDLLGENGRLAIDFSYRASLPSDTGKPGGFGAIGFDAHKVFSTSTRDIGTLVAQGYLLRFDNARMFPPVVEDDDDWEWTFRIFSFNLTALSDGEFNVEFGHLELPFGLEQTFDSNGTVRNYQLMPNLGFMTDWGVGVNGTLPSFDYRVSLTRGSGIQYRDNGEPWAVCGRVATPGEREFVVGLSGFHGELGKRGSQIHRSRGAIDVQFYRGLWAALGEISVGEDDDDARTQLILELDRFNTDDTLLTYLQSISRWRETGGSTDSYHRLALGMRYQPGGGWDVSGELRQDLEPFGANERVFEAVAQLRYRF